MSGSQSLQDQTGSALSEVVSAGSPRPEMPRQNSDPTSDTPEAPLRATGREERDRDRDRDRTAWLREEDIPPKVRELGHKSNEKMKIIIYNIIIFNSQSVLAVAGFMLCN